MRTPVLLAAAVAALLMLAPEPASAARVLVEVEHVHPDGAVKARAGVEVSLETWQRRPGPGQEETLTDLRVGTTDHAGRVAFDGLMATAGGQLRASALIEGVTFRTTSPISLMGAATAPATIRTYDVGTDPSRLTGSAQVDLSVRDAFVIVDLALALENPDRVAVDLGRASAGLPFPVPLPSVFGGALPQGMIPSGTAARHMSTRAVPDTGRFVFRRGGLFWDGVVLPGQRQTLQVRYALPIVDSRQDLAFTTPVDLDALVVSATFPDRTSPRVVPDRPYRGVERARGELRDRFARVTDPPKRGETFVVGVDRLPVARVFYHALALGGAGLLLLVFALTLVSAGARRRDGGGAGGRAPQHVSIGA